MAVGLMLGGCAAIPGAVTIPETWHVDRLVTSDVDPRSIPGFVNDPQTEIDMIADLPFTDIDPASIRYQGEWEGTNIYLGVTGTATARFITLLPDVSEGWGASGSFGNVVHGLGTGLDGEMNVQYLPHGTAEPPEGWIALSDWIIVRP